MLAAFAGVTDPGRRRRRNEDAYVCEPPLFAIADVMGGAQAGEVASGLAAAVLEEATGDERGEERVASLIQEANRRVFKRSNEDAATSGMGTTMTVALLDHADGTIAFGHVGDSRAYRVRGGELEQLTDDHSLVGELVRKGELSETDAERHPQRSVITRAPTQSRSARIRIWRSLKDTTASGVSRNSKAARHRSGAWRTKASRSHRASAVIRIRPVHSSHSRIFQMRCSSITVSPAARRKAFHSAFR